MDLLPIDVMKYMMSDLMDDRSFLLLSMCSRRYHFLFDRRYREQVSKRMRVINLLSILYKTREYYRRTLTSNRKRLRDPFFSFIRNGFTRDCERLKSLMDEMMEGVKISYSIEIYPHQKMYITLSEEDLFTTNKYEERMDMLKRFGFTLKVMDSYLNGTVKRRW